VDIASVLSATSLTFFPFANLRSRRSSAASFAGASFLLAGAFSFSLAPPPAVAAATAAGTFSGGGSAAAPPSPGSDCAAHVASITARASRSTSVDASSAPSCSTPTS